MFRSIPGFSMKRALLIVLPLGIVVLGVLVIALRQTDQESIQLNPPSATAARETLDRFMQARIDGQDRLVLAALSVELQARADNWQNEVWLYQVSNPCWYRYAVVQFEQPTPTRARARVRVYQHDWAGDVAGGLPQSWEQAIGLVETSDEWLVHEMDMPENQRAESFEPHGPTLSACNAQAQSPTPATTPTALPQVASIPSAPRNTLGGFPFPYGTTWVYSRVEYAQAIGSPDQILTATRVVTETVGATPINAPSYTFRLERTVTDISEPDGWWGGSPLEAGEYWYRVQGNQILSIQFPTSQSGSLLYDFPLAADKSWCPQQPPPPQNPQCISDGRRTVQRRMSYMTPIGTFDDCYEISEEYTSGGVWEWFCDGIGTVARKYDHGGTRFGFQDTLIRFTRGAGAR